MSLFLMLGLEKKRKSGPPYRLKAATGYFQIRGQLATLVYVPTGPGDDLGPNEPLDPIDVNP
jgi:hypothetical protein